MSSSSASQVRILIVDDEKDILTVLQMLLDDSGYKTDGFESPKAALAAFTPGTYQIALVDLRMREMDGFELSRHFIQADSAIKVCFMTSFDWYSLPSSLRLSESVIPAERYFRKPFSAMHLPTSIRDLLEGESAN